MTRTDFNDENMFVLSSQMSYLYTFNLTHAQIVSISQPFMTLNELSSNESLTITATSMARTCEVDFNLEFIEEVSDIVHKKDFADQKFMVDPTDGLSLNLKKYYGGSNLKYQASNNKSQDFDVSVSQI